MSDYNANLTPQQGIEVSRRADVVAVSRQPLGAVLADERSNRIIAGDFGQAGTSWPKQIGNTSPPYYWNSYLDQLAAAGVNPANQIIGFLDSGVDEALKLAGPIDNCPPSLVSSGSPCALDFTTDASSDFDYPHLKADDWRMHGSAVVAIAAGRSISTRDGHGYAHTQGVAPGVLVAMSKVLCAGCSGESNTRRSGPDIGEIIDLDSSEQLLRYSIVELTNPGTLPGRPVEPSKDVLIFNHSWNVRSGGGHDAREYDAVSKWIDVSARDLGCVYFWYRDFEAVWQYYGPPGVGALHVMAAGNRYSPLPPDDLPLADPGSDQEVQSPGNAKNGLTVGATRTDDDRFCSTEPYPLYPNCWGAENLMGSNPRVVAGFSRIGYPEEQRRENRHRACEDSCGRDADDGEGQGLCSDGRRDPPVRASACAEAGLRARGGERS
jgi:hypothetical protein